MNGLPSVLGNAPSLLKCLQKWHCVRIESFFSRDVITEDKVQSLAFNVRSPDSMVSVWGMACQLGVWLLVLGYLQ